MLIVRYYTPLSILNKLTDVIKLGGRKLMLDKEQEALDILLDSGAKVIEVKSGAIFMTLKPTEDNHEKDDVVNKSNQEKTD